MEEQARVFACLIFSLHWLANPAYIANVVAILHILIGFICIILGVSLPVGHLKPEQKSPFYPFSTPTSPPTLPSYLLLASPPTPLAFAWDFSAAQTNMRPPPWCLHAVIASSRSWRRCFTAIKWVWSTGTWRWVMGITLLSFENLLMCCVKGLGGVLFV